MKLTREEAKNILTMLNSEDTDNANIAFEALNAYDFKNEDFGYLVYLYKFSKNSKEVWKEKCIKHYNTLDKKCNLSKPMSYATALSYIISTKANKDIVEISLEKHVEHIGNSLGKLGYPIDKLEFTIKIKE
jgi:hypothetical protein